jgi:hypothetical protein
MVCSDQPVGGVCTDCTDCAASGEATRMHTSETTATHRPINFIWAV